MVTKGEQGIVVRTIRGLRISDEKDGWGGELTCSDGTVQITEYTVVGKTVVTIPETVWRIIARYAAVSVPVNDDGSCL